MDDTRKAQLIEKLLAVAKKEIRVSYQKNQNAISPLDSKIGGKPAVPDDFVWPYYAGTVYNEEERKSRPLSFMAQIRLKDLAGLDDTGLLPQSGTLSFFYELETMTWGFDPSDKGAARVFYFPEDTVLHEAAYPEELEDYARLPELAVHFRQNISLPEYGDYDGNDDYTWEDYDECCTECGYECDGWGERTKILGYPDVIQNPMEEECEAVTRGFREGSVEDFKQITEAERADIAEKAKDWIMLFQMGTIEVGEYELMFGDCGHIYYWIRKDDLLHGRFENIWLILQCS